MKSPLLTLETITETDSRKPILPARPISSRGAENGIKLPEPLIHMHALISSCRASKQETETI